MSTTTLSFWAFTFLGCLVVEYAWSSFLRAFFFFLRSFPSSFPSSPLLFFNLSCLAVKRNLLVFFFLKLKIHCHKEKRVQQRERKSQAKKQFTYNLSGSFQSAKEDKLLSKPEIIPSASHTKQERALLCCNLFSHA